MASSSSLRPERTGPRRRGLSRPAKAVAVAALVVAAVGALSTTAEALAPAAKPAVTMTVHAPELTSAATAIAAPALTPMDTATTPANPQVSIDLGGTTGTNTQGAMSSGLTTALLLGVVSLVPALLVMMTSFSRIIIVLGLTRSAIGTQNVPPNQVLIGLGLFLSLFVMGPSLQQANHDGIQPYLKGQITQTQAYDRTIEPFREFMLKEVREKDLALMVKLSDQPRPAKPADVKTTTLVPAFVISELRTAFLIGFIILIPFLIIDLITSAVLSSVGMMMLPPSLVSLPFKLLLFVAADGWYLIVQSLVQSFHTQ